MMIGKMKMKVILMDVPNDIVYNFMMDLRKKDIDKVDRANIINKYLDENGLSQNKLARQLGIPKNTLQDWLLYGRINKKLYNKLLDKGIGEKQIYWGLRENKNVSKISDIHFDTPLDRSLKECITKIRPFINNTFKETKDTENLIKDNINICNRLLMVIDQQRKL